jgi:hypothetical protein
MSQQGVHSDIDFRYFHDILDHCAVLDRLVTMMSIICLTVVTVMCAVFSGHFYFDVCPW